MIQWLYKIFFTTILGWRIEGNLPESKQYVLIVAPHTSNLDFFIGVFCRRILAFNPRFVAKKELFIFPFGYFFKWMGGYPVDRSGHHNFVEIMAELFKKEQQFILTMTPEGTRSRNDHWKSGYYYVSKTANVPILPVAFDYSKRKVVLGETEFATDSLEDNIEKYKKYFSQFKGKNPEKGVIWNE